jgi:RhoGAP domain
LKLVDFNEYNVHVLTSVLKSVFRDMAEPLMTFDLYPDFIAATGNEA